MQNNTNTQEPEFYQGLKTIAEQCHMEYIEAYKQAADVVAEALTEDPNSWRNYIPGMMVWLEDCGLKFDGANNIGAAVEYMTDGDRPNEWNGGKPNNRRRLAMVQKIIDTTDEELQLFPYCAELPEGCTTGGARCDDEEAQARARERWQKYNDKAAEQKYYNYWFSLVTMFRSPNYCVFIDAEGYNWCRYLLFLTTWRTMYAAEMKAAQEAEQRRQEEEAAEQFVEETKEMLKYKSDCDQLRPYMVADLSAYELSDRRGRQSGRRRNILAVLRHYFPGVKFSVKYRWASHTELEVEWTDGPTRKEVESVCNWSIFCDTWESFDGMTDSTSRGSMKYTEFAKQYGGGFLDGISFDRSNSPETIEECREYARSIFETCGLDTARDYSESSTEGMKIYNACPYLNGSDYYWYSVNSIAEIVAAKLSHFAA